MQSTIFSRLNSALLPVTGFGLAFRRLALCDTGPLFDATRDPRFNEFLLWPRPSNRAQLLERVERLIKASDAGDIAALSVVDATTGQWVSLWRFVPWYDDPSRVELGIWTHPQMWKKRMSVGITRLALDAAFDRTDVEAVYGAAASVNAASIRMMQAAGMSVVGVVDALRPGEGARAFAATTLCVGREDWRAARTSALYGKWSDPEPQAEPTPSDLGALTIDRMRGETLSGSTIAEATAHSRAAAATLAALSAGARTPGQSAGTPV